MNKNQPQPNYASAVRDIRAIIERGHAGAQKAFERQALLTNWEVGRYLSKHLPLKEGRSAGNAKVIGRLARTFKKSETHFYAVMKLYRYYPDLPEVGLSLSWTHYLALLPVEDPLKREHYRKRALKEHMPARELYGLIVHDNKIGGVTDPGNAQGPASDTTLSVTRGKLYHYRIAATPADQPKEGVVTLDLGFKVFRDVVINKRVDIRPGYLVRTEHNTTRAASDAIQNFSAKRSSLDRDILYTYKAKVERVIDGDTIVCMIDLGLRTRTRQRLRLRGIDTPEMTTNRGLYVRDYVRKLLNKRDFVIVKTYKDDKYGRMLADVFYGGSIPGGQKNQRIKDLRGWNPAMVATKGLFLNQELLAKGLAEVM